MDRMFPCSECQAEWPSELAATECADADKLEDLHNRQYFNR